MSSLHMGEYVRIPIGIFSVVFTVIASGCEWDGESIIGPDRRKYSVPGAILARLIERPDRERQRAGYAPRLPDGSVVRVLERD